MKGDILKAIIRAKGVSNKSVAAKLGISETNLSQMLAKDDIRTGLVEGVADALGISIGEIYGIGPTVTASGEHSTAVAGNGNQVNAGKLIDEVAAQRRLTEAALVQNDKLIAIIETITKKQ